MQRKAVQTVIGVASAVRTVRTLLGGLALLLASAPLPVQGDLLVWDFPIDEAQVKNGPEPDGSTNSPGKGHGRIEFNTVTGEMSVEITWEGLVGDLSKLHVHGPAGPEHSTPRHVLEFLGPPEIPETLATPRGTFSSKQLLTGFRQEGFPSLPPHRILRVLVTGNAYLNVHSTIFGMGEIRGNVGPPVTIRQKDGEPTDEPEAESATPP